MLPLHHMRLLMLLIETFILSKVYFYLALHLFMSILDLLHPAGLEPTVCSSEVRRVTNYARSAIHFIDEQCILNVYSGLLLSYK